MKYLAVLLCLVSFVAFGQTGTAVLSCTAPTKNTDGTNITGTISYKFYRGTTSTSQPTASPVQTACAYTFTGLAVGTHYFSATATVGGIESAKTAPVSKVIAPPTPEPPSNLVVAADQLVAYGSQQSNERQTIYAVGTVMANTACDPTMSANGLYRVPKSAVVWAGDVRPPVTFASCVPSGG